VAASLLLFHTPAVPHEPQFQTCATQVGALLPASGLPYRQGMPFSGQSQAPDVMRVGSELAAPTHTAGLPLSYYANCERGTSNHQGKSRVGPLNRKVTSRTLGRLSITINILFSPKPNPPCGGQPYLKKSR